MIKYRSFGAVGAYGFVVERSYLYESNISNAQMILICAKVSIVKEGYTEVFEIFT
jgi:hypothetical protein